MENLLSRQLTNVGIFQQISDKSLFGLTCLVKDRKKSIFPLRFCDKCTIPTPS